MYKKQVRLFNEAIRLITMKVRLKTKHRSQRCKINTSRPGHGHKYAK